MTATRREHVLRLAAPDEATPTTPWDAQPQYVGALLGQPASAARRLLELVPDAAITHPVTRWIHELARSLVDEGRDPHPTSVLRRAHTQPAHDALRPEASPTHRDLQRLGPHLVDLYANALPGIPIADQARAVLDDAYRSAYRSAGIKMQYLAETRSRTDELGTELVALCSTMADLRGRIARCAALLAQHPV